METTFLLAICLNCQERHMEEVKIIENFRGPTKYGHSKLETNEKQIKSSCLDHLQ